MARRVLVTGVSGFWGNQLAGRLERRPEIEYIAGLDVRPPGAHLERTHFIRADIRNPVLSRIVPETGVDTVVHCDVLLAPEPGKTARQLHDINVIGSLQLLAACELTDSVRAIVVRGSAAIYGAEPNAPRFFTEGMARRFPLRTRFQRDVGELESYFETFSRRYGDVTVTMMRFQPSLGGRLESPLTRYLRQPVVPVQLGFDPLLQFVHADDAVVALEAATLRPVPGPVNVAGEGSISLSRLLKLAGRISVPVPSALFGAALRTSRRVGLADLPPDAVRWLQHGVTVDCERLVEEIGYRPRSTPETVQNFLSTLDPPGPVAGFLRGRRRHEGAEGSPAARPAAAIGGR